MRRVIAPLLLLLIAGAARGGTPYFLDRAGSLWNATASPEGLVLTGQQDGQTTVRAVLPFDLGMAGTTDTQIQVAADEITGKVVVVWQRNWSPEASEIILAVWGNGAWERVEHLTDNLGGQPRNPAVQLSEFEATIPDPEDPTQPIHVQDSYLHVVWWEGAGEGQHASYALLRLTAEPGDPDALYRKDLDEFASLGLACELPAPPEVLEHPVFAANAGHDRALLFFGSQRICLLHLVEIRFELEPLPPSGPGPINVTVQRRRSVPIFGIRRTFQMPRDLSMEGTRIILGDHSNPVAYRVTASAVEYATATATGWSPRRELALGQGFAVDQRHCAGRKPSPLVPRSTREGARASCSRLLVVLPRAGSKVTRYSSERGRPARGSMPYSSPTRRAASRPAGETTRGTATWTA